MNEEIEKTEERKLQKVKNHIKEHQTAYLAGAAGIVVGAIGTALFMHKRYGMIGADIPVPVLSAHIEGKHINASITQQTISIYGNKIGRPGVPVIDTATGKRFESMSLAADSIGVTPARIAEQVHGRSDHVNGHIFALAE